MMTHTQDKAQIRKFSNNVGSISLFLITIAKSGERKSTVDNKITKPIREIEFDNSTCFIINDPTTEGLLKAFGSQKSLGVFNDEAGVILGGYSLIKDNFLKSIATWSKLWDGTPITEARIGRDSIHLKNRVCTMHLMGQPEVMSKILSDKQANDQGVLSRFLIHKPQSNIGQRKVRYTNPQNEVPNLDKFCDTITSLMSDKSILAMPDEPFENILELSENAQILIEEYADWLEIRQGKFKEFENFTANASKSAEQALRIAGVLTLYEDVEAESVSKETMENAITLAKFYLYEFINLYEEMAVDQIVVQADQLLEWLREKWPAQEKSEAPDTITSTDILQYGPSKLRNKKTLEPIINILKENGNLVDLAPDKSKQEYNIVFANKEAA